MLARLRLRPTSHVERHLTTPEPPAGSAGSSLEPSCHEPRWKFGSTVKIRGAQECLARLRLRPTSHVERHLTTPEPPAGSAGSSLEPSCHEPRWKFGSTVKIRGAQECLARLRLRPTSHVERHLTTPEPPAGSAGSSLEPSCHEPRWKFGSTVKIRGAQECLVEPIDGIQSAPPARVHPAITRDRWRSA